MFAGKIVATKSSYDSDSVLSTATAASDKVLIPGSQSDGPSPLAGQSGISGTVSEDPQVSDMIFLLLVLLRLLALSLT